MAKARYMDYVRMVRGFNSFTRLLECDCINGFAVGLKVTDCEVTNKICIIVYVNEKLDLRRLPMANRIPKTLRMPSERTKDGYVDLITDVQAARFSAVQVQERVRPAPAGVSVGHVNITAGTFGGLVMDKATGATVMLSNNHVLADSNSGVTGDPIIQPGAADGGAFPADHIANLERFVPITFGSGNENRVDAAIAKPLVPADVMWETVGIGPMTPSKRRHLLEGDLGIGVRKTGRTTGTTEGFVQALHGSVQVQYSMFNKATFVDQIIISQPADAPTFSEGGDSGSLVYDLDDNLVGLLFAGSQASGNTAATTIINPISCVFDELGVALLTDEEEDPCADREPAMPNQRPARQKHQPKPI